MSTLSNINSTYHHGDNTIGRNNYGEKNSRPIKREDHNNSHKTKSKTEITGMYDGLHVPEEYIRNSFLRNSLSETNFAQYQEIKNIKNLEERAHAISDFSNDKFGNPSTEHTGVALHKIAASTYLQASEAALRQNDLPKAIYLMKKGIKSAETAAKPNLEGNQSYLYDIIANLSEKLAKTLLRMPNSTYETRKYFEKAAHYHNLYSKNVDLGISKHSYL